MQKNHLTLCVNNGSMSARAENSFNSGTHAPKEQRDFLCLNEYASNGVTHGESARIQDLKGESARLTIDKFSTLATMRVTKSLNGGDVNHLSIEAFMTSVFLIDDIHENLMQLEGISNLICAAFSNNDFTPRDETMTGVSYALNGIGERIKEKVDALWDEARQQPQERRVA